MKVLIISDLHDQLSVARRVFEVALSELSKPDLVLFCGDFGSKNATLRGFAALLEEFSLTCVACYGNHECPLIRDWVKQGISKELALGRLSILSLGATKEVCGLRILAISGNRGSGRKWTHWRDQQVREVINSLAQTTDVVLSHEMPYEILDECVPGKHCGQRVLRELVERVRPLLFVGGHLHLRPAAERLAHGTVVIHAGALSHLDPRMRPGFVFVELDHEIKVRCCELGKELEVRTLVFTR